MQFEPQIDPADDFEGYPWMTSPMVCSRCGHEWVAVHERCERLECSKCGFLEQTPPAKRGEPQREQ